MHRQSSAVVTRRAEFEQIFHPQNAPHRDGPRKEALQTVNQPPGSSHRNIAFKAQRAALSWLAFIQTADLGLSPELGESTARAGGGELKSQAGNCVLIGGAHAAPVGRCLGPPVSPGVVTTSSGMDVECIRCHVPTPI